MSDAKFIHALTKEPLTKAEAKKILSRDPVIRALITALEGRDEENGQTVNRDRETGMDQEDTRNDSD